MRARENDTTAIRGREAEAAAARFLTARGLRILTRNYRVRGGEIDLVCSDGDTLVFVEVRYRSRADFGGAAASITAAKQARLRLAAQHYLAGRPTPPCRFDCVLFDGAQTTWIRDAFADL